MNEVDKKNIELLENAMKYSERVGHDISLSSWSTILKGIIERIWGKDSIKIKELDSYIAPNINISKNYRKQVITINQVLIDEIKINGSPEFIYDGKNTPISISQSQSNSQSINIQFIMEALKHDLESEQIEEIKEIAQSDDSKPDKREKLINKLKSFGSNVASNIAASILTNPLIWAGM